MFERPTKRVLEIGAAGVLALLAAGCSRPGATAPATAAVSGPAGENKMPLTTSELNVTSPAFTPNARIPPRYTGEGPDVSPALAWSGVAGGAPVFGLVMDDPDAPRPEPWVHWVIYKIPGSTTGLAENVEKTPRPAQPAGVVQGKNTWGRAGYGGPMPPPGHGTHHYHFRLYALDAPLNAGPGLSKDELLKAMQGHVIGEGELVGTYERK
ncbi:MAG: YbhB/YbcL family Raf kinase inhibitor-like protein [Planctomycetota bacterium]